jgi:hypothetical protein
MIIVSMKLFVIKTTLQLFVDCNFYLQDYVSVWVRQVGNWKADSL